MAPSQDASHRFSHGNGAFAIVGLGACDPNLIAVPIDICGLDAVELGVGESHMHVLALSSCTNWSGSRKSEQGSWWARARDSKDVVQQEIDASTAQVCPDSNNQRKGQLFAQRGTQLRQWYAAQDPEVMDIEASGAFDERVISRFVMEASVPIASLAADLAADPGGRPWPPTWTRKRRRTLGPTVRMR